MSELGYISSHRYGKDLVRVARVVRDGDKHSVIEYTIRALLDGDIATSYTKADNSVVVPTDTIKNTVNVFAKTSAHVLDPPAFALHLGLHFVTRYAHISKAYIDLAVHKWSRIEVDGQPHKHAFVRDGDDKGVVQLAVDGSNKDALSVDLKVGVKDLLVLKTGGSAFEGFWTDELTTLVPVKDRLFSTSVEYMYTVPLPPNAPVTIDAIPAIAAELNFADIAAKVRRDTLEVFATDESASVQATMYNTAQKVLVSVPAIKEISYSYPNKHYIPINLAPFKLENNLGYDGGAEVFHPVADPSGLIQATITRK